MEEQQAPQTDENTKVKRANYYLVEVTQSFATKRGLVTYLNENNGLGANLKVVRGLEVKPEAKQVFDVH